MRRLLLRAGLVAGACLVLTPFTRSQAHDYRAGEIAIAHLWTRAVGVSAPTAAGYLVLRNQGSVPDRLIAAASPMARAVELHSMTMTDNVMRMRPIPDGVALPLGQDVRFEPGGLHIMLVGPTGGFTQGMRVPLTLRFEHAGEVTVELSVEAAGARAGAHQGH